MICIGSGIQSQTIPSFFNIAKDSIYKAYVNIDYMMKIKKSSVSNDLIEIKANGAYVHQLNDSIYAIRYNAPTEGTKIKLYYRGLPVDICNLRVDNLVAPAVKLAGQLGPFLSITDLKQIRKIELDKSIDVELFQCRMLITEPGKPLTFNANIGGQALPEHIIKLLGTLTPNSTIRFDEFKLRTPQNYVLDVEGSSVTFIIVE